MNNNQTPNKNIRYHGLDALRAIALILGLFYHAAIPFSMDSQELYWIVYDNNKSWLFDFITVVSHSFRMPLFFVLAGFFSALLYLKFGMSKFVLMRFKKIVIPFFVSISILSPVMIVQYVLSGYQPKSAAESSAFEFSNYPIFHLWFLEVLIFVTAIVLLMIFFNTLSFSSLFKRVGHSIYIKYGPNKIILLAYIIVFGIVLWTSWSDFPGDQFVQSYLLIQPADKVIFYLMFFLIGWVLYDKTHLLFKIQSSTRQHWAIGLVAAGVLYFTRYWLYEHDNHQYPLLLVIGNIAVVLAAIHLSLAFFGLFSLEKYQPSKFVHYMVQSSYWIYLIHLPIMFYLQVELVHWQVNPLFKYILTISITLALCCVSYNLILMLKSSLIKLWFWLKTSR